MRSKGIAGVCKDLGRRCTVVTGRKSAGSDIGRSDRGPGCDLCRWIGWMVTYDGGDEDETPEREELVLELGRYGWLAAQAIAPWASVKWVARYVAEEEDDELDIFILFVRAS
jgi:hypothetical protein